MKIISWNCNCAFRNKYSLLPEVDILIIPESESPDFLSRHNCRLPFGHHLWAGKSAHKGLSIFTCGGYKAKIADFYDETFQYILPVEITNGTKNFILWAVWTQSEDNDSYNGYVVIAVRALIHYQKYFDENSLIIGDFNSNARWNKNFKQDFNHAKLVDFLGQKHFHSLYHYLNDCSHGAENEATIYMYKDRSRPYYIDYAFFHENRLSSRPQLKIGQYDEWIKHSDHMPLFIEFP